jgi:mRNA-degrading endonuclease RelE of RelBE toxin-antitoxin system
MSYRVFLSSKAGKQYKKLDKHIRDSIKSNLDGLKQYPRKSYTLSGKYADLRYIKIIHKGVHYRIVYDVSDEKKEVLIIFLGTRENFYKELRRYLG